MNQKVILVSDQHKQRALTIISGLPADGTLEVVVKHHKRDRTLDQNALLWKWYTIIAAELGDTKEAIHEHYKGKYLVNIYERDNEEYAEMIQALRNVYRQGMKTEAQALRAKIVTLTSTATATVKQMTEYMQNIERDAAELAIRLPAGE